MQDYVQNWSLQPFSWDYSPSFSLPLCCVRQFYDDFNARFVSIYNVAMSRSCTEHSYINNPGKSSCESSWNWTANFANRYCVLNFPQTDWNYSFATEGNRKLFWTAVDIILSKNHRYTWSFIFLLFLLRHHLQHSKCYEAFNSENRQVN